MDWLAVICDEVQVIKVSATCSTARNKVTLDDKRRRTLCVKNVGMALYEAKGGYKNLNT